MPNASSTLPLPQLDAAGICEHCVRGMHRQCRHPDCECTVANAGIHSHANRPKGSAARRAKEPTSMTATAPTPIRREEPKKTTVVPPVLAIKKVDELPETTTRSQMPSLTQRVVNALNAAELEAGEWYEVLTYTSPQGPANAVTRMSKLAIAAPYEFVNRGFVVYARLKAE